MPLAPTLPPDSPETVFDIIALIRDADACAKRLQALQDATAEYRSISAQAALDKSAAAQSLQDAQSALIQAQAQREEIEGELTRRTSTLEQNEKDYKTRLAQITAREADHEAAVSDDEARLSTESNAIAVREHDVAEKEKTIEQRVREATALKVLWMDKMAQLRALAADQGA